MKRKGFTSMLAAATVALGTLAAQGAIGEVEDILSAMGQPDGPQNSGGGSNCWVIHGSRTVGAIYMGSEDQGRRIIPPRDHGHQVTRLTRGDDVSVQHHYRLLDPG